MPIQRLHYYFSISLFMMTVYKYLIDSWRLCRSQKRTLTRLHKQMATSRLFCTTMLRYIVLFTHTKINEVYHNKMVNKCKIVHFLNQIRPHVLRIIANRHCSWVRLTCSSFINTRRKGSLVLFCWTHMWIWMRTCLYRHVGLQEHFENDTLPTC